ncbi:MAG: phosphoglucosamine mutase [Bacillota bacterium]
MGELFGTDGVRGIANKELTAELAFKLGRAGAYVLSGGQGTIFIGRDTRVSGDLLEAALIAGICSTGANAVRLGIIPTPGVAFLTRSMGADAGIVISASHNPVEDNGIKFFDSKGFKLGDEEESRIEAAVKDDLIIPRPTGLLVGRAFTEVQGLEKYALHVANTVNCDFSGLRIVVDCGCGAAWEAAPRILTQLGAEVIAINNQPDGSRINVNCGSTNVKALIEQVLKLNADAGIAHDGDADRVIAVDEKGNIVDGDSILLICGLHLAEKGLLRNRTVVVTVMSNLGLEIAFNEAGIKIHRTPVGDKYVLRKMLEENASLGGEQSGHIIFSDHCTTGDGIVSAVQLISVMKEKGEPLSALTRLMKKLPQTMVNVRVKDKEAAQKSEALAKALKAAEEELGNTGRILVRPSGTEPVIRVMVESPTEEQCTEIADRVAAVISGQA